MAKLLRLAKAPADTAARGDIAARAAALDTRSSCVVEAPAGSGKTGLLVQRYLSLLAEESVEQPEEVLAITFTNKATAELRERVLEQLERAARGDTEQAGGGDGAARESSFDRETGRLAKAALRRSMQHGWALLERPNRLNIRSIDSVCAEIANSLPLLSGAGGPRTPVEDAEPLYRLAARRTLLQLGGGDALLHEALSTVLLHRDGNLAECETLIAGMLQTREQWGELLPLTAKLETDAGSMDEVRARLERTLESVVRMGLARALRAMPAEALEALTALAARLATEPGVDGPSPIALCAELGEPPQAVADHREHWVALIGLLLRSNGEWRKRHSRGDLKFEIAKADAARLKRMVEEIQSEELREALAAVLRLPPTRYPDDQWEVARALFRVLRHALAELRLLFVERGECDFTELALAAREALRADDGASEFVLSAGGTLRHMLVDEMQDTSSGQYELLELQAVLVSDFNETFDRIFPRPAATSGGEPDADWDTVDVPFVEAAAVREETGGPGVVWHTKVFEKEAARGDDAGEEARMIRRIVEERYALPLPPERNTPAQCKPWRIAVLGRAKRHLAAVIEEFKRDDGSGPVPYRAIDLDSLDERPEVLDALALTRALLHPSDRVAWLAVLHAPWCGLGIADLLALTGEGDDADHEATILHLAPLRRSFLSPDGRQRLDRVWPVLASAVETLGRTSLATQVERTWRSLGGDAALQVEERENVLRYLRVLRGEEAEENGVDFAVLTDRLERLYAEPGSSSIQNGRLPVELLSIHKAKGLEWDLVLVPGLERGSGQSRNVLLNWQELDGLPDGSGSPSIVLAPIGPKGADSDKDKLSGWLTGIRAYREAAENKRVFYVASTRAREELHLFATATRTAKGKLSKPRFNSLLKACWAAVEDRFEELAGVGGAAEGAEGAEADEELAERSQAFGGSDEDTLELAAESEAEGAARPVATIQRLPLGFDPLARFREAEQHRLAYPAASALRHAARFARPEGSFAARAFGNVVHRYLQLVAMRLDTGSRDANRDAELLLRELPSWQPRLTASLRAEGLAPRLAARESARVEQALSRALRDPVGRWILSPHPLAASERAVTIASVEASSLQVDRMFLAGEVPHVAGDTCIWIVDFKTSEQGSRSDQEFEENEMEKYRAQLEAYASLRRVLPQGDLPIRLGLFYPLIPRLIHWESSNHAEMAV